MSRQRLVFRWLGWLAVAAVLLGAAYGTRALWLGALGRALVLSESPFQAEAVVVLAGDDTGERILKGAELVKEGHARIALVSGPQCCYGMHESDLAIPFAVRHGYPQQWFVPVTSASQSTRDEAQAMVREIERRQIARFLVVTSNYHSARAARVYRALVPAARFRMISTSDPRFDPDAWWRTREGEKQFAMEWMKTVAYWIGK